MMDNKKTDKEFTPSDPACASSGDGTEQSGQPSDPPADKASFQRTPSAPTSPSGDEDSNPTSAAKPPRSIRQIKIGSQRDDGKRSKEMEAKPQGFTPTPHTKEEEQTATNLEGKSQQSRANKQPPPALQSESTADIQKEIELALGDETMDTLMMSAGEKITAEELAAGEQAKGQILSINEENLFVDLGRRNQGIIPLKQLKEIPAIGSVIDVVVSRLDREEGIYELAVRGAAIDVAGWNELSEGLVVDALVTGHNKGGLEVEVNRLRGFIPTSQVALYRIDNLEELVGQKFACVVMEADANRRNLVLSRRAMLERQRAEAKKQILSDLEVGAVREGIVVRLQPFGAFVDLGGIDGLIHISQLSWDRIGHPKEVLEEGQKIKVTISRINLQTGKIGLSYRDTFDNPWETAAARYQPNSRVSGTVSKLTDFGAFVRLEAGIEGLLHVSEISHRRVFRPSDVLSEGQELELQLVAIDLEAQRISLSLKALEQPPEKKKKSETKNSAKEPPSPSSKQTKNHGRENLKGGTDRASGGEQFGLKW